MKNKQAFTLIELLVVVLIIGILSAIALPQYQKAVIKARASELQTLTRAIATAQSTYYMANGEWADNFDNLDIEFSLTPAPDELEAAFHVDDAKIKGMEYGIGIRGEEGTSCSVFLSGPYAGKAGFISLGKAWGILKDGELYCWDTDDVNFCHKFYNGTYIATDAYDQKYYSLY